MRFAIKKGAENVVADHLSKLHHDLGVDGGKELPLKTLSHMNSY